MIDYTLLRIIWWALLGVLLIGFAIMDGFDLGAAALLPFVAKKDNERRIVINTVGPVWEGNQVWFILGGGAIFAAWPAIYATSFSGFYLAMFFVLLTFIVRPVGFKYRSKMKDSTWRSSWDYTLCIAAIIASVVFGVAIGNVLQGVPFHFDHELRVFYTGSFWQLLNPFGLYCGITSLCMIAMQGGTYLANKTDGIVNERATRIARYMARTTLLLFVIGGYWVSQLNGYSISSHLASDGPSNPLYKTVAAHTGAWLENYKLHPYFIVAPVLGVLGAFCTCWMLGKNKAKTAIIASSSAIFGIISTVGLSLFPFLLPSSSHPSMSLTVWDASSSQLTLTIMTYATAVFMPIILAYTAWAFRVMRGVVTEKTIHDNDQSY